MHRKYDSICNDTVAGEGMGSNVHTFVSILVTISAAALRQILISGFTRNYEIYQRVVQMSSGQRKKKKKSVSTKILIFRLFLYYYRLIEFMIFHNYVICVRVGMYVSYVVL